MTKKNPRQTALFFIWLVLVQALVSRTPTWGEVGQFEGLMCSWVSNPVPICTRTEVAMTKMLYKQ